MEYCKIQYISQGDSAIEQLKNICEVLDAGCKWVQLRFKEGSKKELHDLAFSVKGLCVNYGATFIMNDHVDIAKAVAADGVHLGLLDMSIASAKQLLGDGMIVGGTANTLTDILQRVKEGCDYIGLGPYRFTSTKKNLSPVLGVEGYRNLIGALPQQARTIPIYAIGGLQYADIEGLLEAGVYGVAISGLLTSHPNKKQLLQQFNDTLYANA